MKDYKLKKHSDEACEKCGSFEYTQRITPESKVICKKCLIGALDSALNGTLEQLGVDARV